MQIKSPKALWQRFAANLSRRPLAALVRYFFAKMFRLGSSEGDEQAGGVGMLLGMLAAPGAFLCVFLLDKYSSLSHYLRGIRSFDALEASVPDRYFLIVFSLAITGIVTALKWQSILPDRQDYLNLAPLPVRPRTILLANSIAVLLVACLFALAVNSASVVLFPVIVVGGETDWGIAARFTTAHVVCVLLAAALGFTGVFAGLGLLLALLPGRVFRFASLWARGAAIVALLALALSTGVVQVAPAAWFLGLSEVLLGRGNELADALARTGLLACAASSVAAAVIYALCYRRSFLDAANIGSQLETRPGGRFLSRIWTRLPLGSAFERACYPFVMRSLLRNDAHCLCVGAFTGLGLLAASGAAINAPTPGAAQVPEAVWLSLPLMVTYMLLLGVRLAFEMPAGVQANWIFQSVLAGAEPRAGALARAALITCVTLAVLPPVVTVYSVLWSPAIGIVHGLFVLTMSLGLIEVLLIGFRKIPFTCSLPPFRNNLIMLCLLTVVGFALFTGPAARIEHWMLTEPVRLVAVPCVAGALYLVRRFRPSDLQQEALPIIFDPLPEPAIEHLRLTDR